MADVNTRKNLQNVVKDLEEIEFQTNCEAHIRQELLELLYKADELLECLLADSAEVRPLLNPARKDKKKGSD